jgi:hypothetical protein
VPIRLVMDPMLSASNKKISSQVDPEIKNSKLFNKVLEENPSDFLKVLLPEGKKRYAKISFICHSNTVPLCTTFDPWIFRKNDDIKVYHNNENSENYKFPTKEYTHKGKTYTKCLKNDCYYAHNRTGECLPEYVRNNCPCNKIAENNNKVRYVSYLEICGQLEGPSKYKESRDVIPDFKKEELAICYNSYSVLSERYPVAIKNKTGTKGWDNILNIDSLMKTFDKLYWFKKYDQKQKRNLRKKFSQYIEKKGIETLKILLKHTLHTINNMFIKTFLALPADCDSYDHYYDSTRKIFPILMEEYMRPVKEIIMVKSERDKSLYIEIKEYFKRWKRLFHSNDVMQRYSIFTYVFRSRVLRLFMYPFIKGLKQRIDRFYSDTLVDYTESPSWYAVGGIMSVTRILGYLPRYIKVSNLLKYLKDMEEKVMIEPSQRLELCRGLAYYLKKNEHTLRSGYAKDLFQSKYRVKHITDDLKEKVIKNLTFDLKGSASLTQKVSDGGKLEDARLLLKMARDNNWKIIIRDLEDGTPIKEFYYKDKADDINDEYQLVIYWLSFQLTINSMYIHHKDEYYKKYYVPYMVKDDKGDEKEYLPQLNDCEIITIDESGKARLLIKSQSTLVWALSIYNKIVQNVLAILPDHKVGLSGAGHAWKHYQRMGAFSEESNFMYDSKVKNDDYNVVKKNVFQCYQDWTEATDNFDPLVSLNLLMVFNSFIGLPKFWSNLNIIAATRPAKYTCTIKYNIATTILTGLFQKGMMMGNPVTKTVLHLMHSAAQGAAEYIMRSIIQDNNMT